jgi:CheY-like chemotaxis protein
MEAHPLSQWSEVIVRRLLIVHDDPAFRCAVRRVLGEAGYPVVECNDTSEALLRALRGEEYGLILCDIDAPRAPSTFMTGWPR